MTDDTLERLGKAFPIGPKLDVLAAGKPFTQGGWHAIRILPAGVPGYATPWSLTRKTVRGQKFYQAEWMDTGNRALFTRKSDAADFLDAHRYAHGYRRITGQLPAWATEKS